MILPRITQTVRITVLVENTPGREGLGSEHGLSYWIDCGPTRILLDTGQSDLFARNAAALGIDISTAQAIVLSHGHYDHAGGLAAAMKIAPNARLYAHPAAFAPKFARDDDGSGRDIGLRGFIEADIGRSIPIVHTEMPTEIAPGIRVTGRVPRGHNFEDTGGPFYRDARCTIPDPLDDDQALYFRCARGLVVLLGCAHAGVINTLSHAQAISGGWTIHAVIGGMHLRAAAPHRLKSTFEAFRDLRIRLLAPGHCTGSHIEALFKREFPDAYAQCRAGSQFIFE